jgi:hypothetical protein
MITVISTIKNNNKTYAVLKCEVCSNLFERLKTWVDHKLLHTNIQTICCSRTCANINKNKKVDVVCCFCKSVYKKPPCEVKRGKNSFCSASCRSTYNNINKTWGSTRSKLERFIEEQFKLELSDISLSCNNRTIIGSELDFYFPDLNCAIQINGITHYKPIYGVDKLNKIQKMDKEKSRLCKEKAIKLLIINCSKDKKDDRKANQKHWNKIKRFILKE